MTFVVAHRFERQRRILAAAVAILLAVCGLAALGAGDARAKDNYVNAGEIPGTAISQGAKAAVDDATGNLLVVDPGNSQVQVWGPGGVAASTQVLTFGTGALTTPYGIAVNESNGDVYVSNSGGGADAIVRFVPDDRANPTTYTVDPTFVSPGQGAAAGQIGNFASPLTIDPATGNLLVADTGNQRVSRFDANGGFLSSFNGSTSQGGVFQTLQDIVVGGGVTYVLDATGPFDPGGPSMTGVSRVERFDSSGGSLGALPNDFGMNKARDLAYGAASGSLFVAQQGIATPFPSVLHVYRNGQEYQTVSYTGVDFFGVPGIAADNGSPTASGRVYGIIVDGAGVGGIHVFDRQQLPDVTIDPPSSITTTSAHFSGTVDPLTGTSTAQFEYSADNGQNWTPVTTTNDTATAPAVGHPEADLTGLTPFSNYQVRLTASNADGSSTSGARTFTTVAAPPVVGGEQATDRGPDSATLRGKVTAFGLATTFHFEYGLSDAYGSRAPLENERSAGSAQAPAFVAQIIKGLKPLTTYHFRIVAHNAAGDAVGGDHTFTTTAAAAPGSSRAYELVSPPDKGGANVKSQLAMQSSMDGNVLAYVGSTAFGGFPDGGTTYPRYIARRSNSVDGWSTRATDPPQARILQDLGPIHTTVGISDDGKKAVVLSAKKLAPGAVENAGNVYLLDVATGAYTTMATTPNITWFEQEAYLRTTLLVQGTPSFDHVLLLAPDTSFLPGVPDGALYEYADGHLTAVSRNAADAVISGSGAGNKDHDRNVISSDGSRVIFSSDDAAYIRSGGTSRPMSLSQRAADPPGTVQPAAVVGADRKLEHVYFLSQNLTDASTPNVVSLYRYDTTSDASHALALLGAVSATSNGTDVSYLQVSADGSTVLFASQAALTPDAPTPTTLKLYAWRNGGLEYIAELVEPTLDFWWVSPNGRYFAFASAANITGYDATNVACSNTRLGEHGACLEIYRYDADAKTIVCASCPVDGRRPVASAYIGETFADVGTHAFPRAVNDDGRVIFGSKEQLVEKDTNSVEDVYEFDGQQQRLISTGDGGPALLGEISTNGNDVFFTTQDRLVAADTDNSTDVYDARVGGGIASQGPPPPSTACSGEDCRGSAGASPPSGSASTEAVGGAVVSPSVPAKARISKLTAGFKGTVLNLTLTVSGPGTIRVSGAKVVAVKRSVAKAGTYKLKVKLTSKQRTLRRKGHRVKAAMTVSFTPVFGKATKTNLTRTAAR
jgi:hypothetical protein